jgi:molybdopterin biosynthesis enzyme MoaB
LTTGGPGGGAADLSPHAARRTLKIRVVAIRDGFMTFSGEAFMMKSILTQATLGNHTEEDRRG